MGFKFSNRSLKAINELHPLLQTVCHDAIEHIDFIVLDAQRGRAEQEKAFRAGNSKAHFGQSAHNWIPAIAFDLVPSPISWEAEGFKKINEVIGYYNPTNGRGKGVALAREIPLRWGADWDMDGSFKDESFLDWGHYELTPWRKWAEDSTLIPD